MNTGICISLEGLVIPYIFVFPVLLEKTFFFCFSVPLYPSQHKLVATCQICTAFSKEFSSSTKFMYFFSNILYEFMLKCCIRQIVKYPARKIMTIVNVNIPEIISSSL